MRFLLLTFLSLFLPLTLSSPLPSIEKRAVSQTTFDNLVKFTKYASGAYLASCPRPLGNTLVLQFSIAATSTDGYIARDDTNKQIVVVFRGSQQDEDAIIDAAIILTPLVSPGVPANTALVHTGFLTAYNAAASTVISTVRAQLAAHPGYTLVTSGHSLGGAMSSLAGLSLKSNFPSSTVIVYTFGQPRTGNPAYAALVDRVIGVGNLFRGVHTTDGVPTLIPTALGYRHHSTEYWQNPDPASPSTTKQCVGDEDPTCSASIPSGGINAAHGTYFGQAMGQDQTVCQ